MLLNQGKLRILHVQLASKTTRDKLRSQEGNSPDHQLRPLNIY